MLVEKSECLILDGVVPLTCHSLCAEEQFRSYHNQRFGVCSSITFVKGLVCFGCICLSQRTLTMFVRVVALCYQHLATY